MTVSKVKDFKKILKMFDDYTNTHLNGEYYAFIKGFADKIFLQIHREGNVLIEANLTPTELIIRQANPQTQEELDFLAQIKGEVEIQNTLFNT